MFQFKDLGITVDVVVLILAVLVLGCMIFSVVILTKYKKMKDQYELFMEGADGESLEEAFHQQFDDMDEIRKDLDYIHSRLERVDKNLLKTYQKIGVVKYDAFKEVGGTLSFVLVLLTKDNNGFIMNSMHSNAEGCYIYIKEVQGGSAFVELSEEERKALEEAKRN